MLSRTDFGQKCRRAGEYIAVLVRKYGGEFIKDLRVEPTGFIQRVSIPFRDVDSRRIECDIVLGWNESVWSAELEHVEMMIRHHHQDIIEGSVKPCERCGAKRGLDGTNKHCRSCADKARDRMREVRSRVSDNDGSDIDYDDEEEDEEEGEESEEV